MAQEKPQEKAKRFYEPKCSPMVDVYEWQVDQDGHHIFVKVGEKNFDDEIQLYKDSTDIKIIVDKLMKGDAPTIAQLSKEGVYGDVNNFPSEYHPAAGAQALHTLYENQPASVKDKFPTYELFEKYFTSLTAAMVDQMFAPSAEEAPKQESEVSGNE